MKNLKIIICIFLFINWQFTANACSCLFLETFCESVQFDSNVFEAEIMEKYEGEDYLSYMDIRIVEIVQGNVNEENYSVINYGTSCDVYIDQFEIGDKIIAKFIGARPSDGIANFEMFSFEVCATSFLKLEGNMVSGNINGTNTSVDYDEFKNTFNECADITLFDRKPELFESLISIFPNPTTDFININNASSFNTEELSVQLFNSQGQLIREFIQINQFSNQLDVQDLPIGVYFVRISLDELSFTKKILKR